MTRAEEELEIWSARWRVSWRPMRLLTIGAPCCKPVMCCARRLPGSLTDEQVLDYAVRIARATRTWPDYQVPGLRLDCSGTLRAAPARCCVVVILSLRYIHILFYLFVHNQKQLI